MGVQISQPIGQLTVRRGIETFGVAGERRRPEPLAIALSIKPGGSAKSVIVEAELKTHGKNVAPLEQEGNVEEMKITGGFGVPDDQTASLGH